MCTSKKKKLFGNPNTRRASSLLTKSISLTSEPSSQTPQGLQHWIEKKNPHGWRIHGETEEHPQKRGADFFLLGYNNTHLWEPLLAWIPTPAASQNLSCLLSMCMWECGYVCVCVCVSLSLLSWCPLSQRLFLFSNQVCMFSVTKTLLGQEDKQWGVWRGEQEEKWKMGQHPNCRNWKSDFNQKAFTCHNIPPPQQHNTNPIYRKAQTLMREREREKERRRGWAIAPYPIIQHTT